MYVLVVHLYLADFSYDSSSPTVPRLVATFPLNRIRSDKYLNNSHQSISWYRNLMRTGGIVTQGD